MIAVVTPRSLCAIRYPVRTGRCLTFRSLTLTSCILIFASKQGLAQQTTDLIELRFARSQPESSSVAKAVADTTFYLARQAIVTDVDIRQASTSRSNHGVVLTLLLSPEAIVRLNELTRAHVHDRVALLINGQLNSPPAFIAEPLNLGTQVDAAVHLSSAAADEFTAAVATEWPFSFVQDGIITSRTPTAMLVTDTSSRSCGRTIFNLDQGVRVVREDGTSADTGALILGRRVLVYIAKDGAPRGSTKRLLEFRRLGIFRDVDETCVNQVHRRACTHRSGRAGRLAVVVRSVSAERACGV